MGPLTSVLGEEQTDLGAPTEVVFPAPSRSSVAFCQEFYPDGICLFHFQNHHRSLRPSRLPRPFPRTAILLPVPWPRVTNGCNSRLQLPAKPRRCCTSGHLRLEPLAPRSQSQGGAPRDGWEGTAVRTMSLSMEDKCSVGYGAVERNQAGDGGQMSERNLRRLESSGPWQPGHAPSMEPDGPGGEAVGTS